MIYALDTNILSYFLKKDEIIRERVILESSSGNQFVIPVVVYFEIRRWLLEKNALKQLSEFNALCVEVPVIGFGKGVWELAAELYVYTRKVGKPSEDADLLIAAQCINNNYTLVTNNIRHFEIMPNLNFVNWK